MMKGKSSRQKQEPGTAKAAASPQSTQQQASSTERRESRSGKGDKRRVGGTAVPGAKSTAPKEAPTSNNPNQQQIEAYNRAMRRRMQRIGAGPSAQEERMQTMQQQRQKRTERKKQRIEERRQHIRRSVPIGGITLGRRSLYLLIGTVLIVLLLIALFIVLRLTNVIG